MEIRVVDLIKLSVGLATLTYISYKCGEKVGIAKTELEVVRTLRKANEEQLNRFRVVN